MVPLRVMPKWQCGPLLMPVEPMPGDLLPLVHMLPHRYQQGAVVAIGGDKTVAVVDLHAVAQAAIPSGQGHGASVGGINGGAVAVGNVQRLVIAGGTGHTGPTGAEEGGDHAVAGPAEAARWGTRWAGPWCPGPEALPQAGSGSRRPHIPGRSPRR